MVTDSQVRRLMKLINEGKTLSVAAAKAGMDEKTARKYRDLGKLPSEVKTMRTWRTREDPFAEVWTDLQALLEVNPGLEAKTLFDDLQRKHPGQFQDGKLRTLQRRVKSWRAVEGPAKEVFFPQVHKPGELCQSDFTHMTSLGITIQGELFAHLIHHFVLTYSNWEAGTVCFSESFESLSAGLQAALWELGGVPVAHQTDRLTAAVHKVDHPEEFTAAYRAVLKHYRLEGRKSQANKPHENGDVEQRHHRFKRAVDQALLLRGSRDFESRNQYECFLKRLFSQLNAGRQERLHEELKVLHRLPACRLDAVTRKSVRVRSSSTIRVQHNVYSVHSRLIGEMIEARIHPEKIEVWYAQRVVEVLPRLRGSNKHRIDYRHIIDWLVRKPGAFRNYLYRDDLFPSSLFRMAYDALKEVSAARVDTSYLRILELAAKEGQTAVEGALRHLLETESSVSPESVQVLVRSGQQLPALTSIEVDDVDLSHYDGLLDERRIAG